VGVLMTDSLIADRPKYTEMQGRVSGCEGGH
jgi:hypothetical protein